MKHVLWSVHFPVKLFFVSQLKEKERYIYISEVVYQTIQKSLNNGLHIGPYKKAHWLHLDCTQKQFVFIFY
jgi:hypothetical protein